MPPPSSCAWRATGVTAVVSTTLESFGLPSADLVAEISVCPSFKEHMARKGNRPPRMCPSCHVHVCHGHPRAPVAPSPRLTMSFYLATDFWQEAAYAHAVPPLPPARIHGEDTKASGREPQLRNGTWTCTSVLKPLLWENSRSRITLVQGGLASPPTTC